jgi:lipopolysaccharide assembly outer membrane protein LptD (OstA)
VPKTKDTVDYSADIVEYSVKDSSVFLAGNAKLNYQSINLTADTVFYFTNTKSMIAVGKPVLIDGTDTLRGEYIAYNIENKSGKVKHGLMQSIDTTAYFGEQIVRTDSAIYASNALYTTCMFPDEPHTHFYCKKIKVIPNDRAIAKPFVLVIGNAPVAALPYFMLPIEKNRTSGWLPIKWGVTLNGRGSVDNVGYYWAINDYLDFSLAGMVDNFENFLAKAETNYSVKDIINGRIYTDYSINNRYLGRTNRWSLEFSHDQNITPDKSLTLKGSGSLVSDKNYFSQFSDDTSKLKEQTLTSNLSLTKRFDNIGGSASLNWNRTQNLNRETIDQDLPSVNFTLNNRRFVELEEGDTTEHLLNKLSWSYAFRGNQKMSERTYNVNQGVLDEVNEKLANGELDSGKIDSIYNSIDSSYSRTFRGASHTIPINMPFNLFKHIKVTPSFTVNQSLFDAYRDTIADVKLRREKLYDTIPYDSIGNIEYKDRELGASFVRNDTNFVLLRYPINPKNPDYDTTYNDTTYDTTYYYQDDFDINKAHQVWWNAGVSISTNLYGIFPVKVGRMQGIRHTVSPTVGYTYTPKKDLDVVFMNVDGVSSPYGTKQRQVVNFGLNNLFETKFSPKDSDTATNSASPQSVKFLDFGFSGNYNFEADSQALNDITLRASIPAQKVNLSYDGTFKPYDMKNELDMPRALRHSINITPNLPQISGNMWSGDMIIYEGFQRWGYLDNIWQKDAKDFNISIMPRYSYTMSRKNVVSEFNTQKTYNLGASLEFMLTERWHIRWNGDWSFTENKFMGQAISLAADLECWNLRLDWYPSGLNEGRIYFIAELKKHRDLKWEQEDG